MRKKTELPTDVRRNTRVTVDTAITLSKANKNAPWEVAVSAQTVRRWECIAGNDERVRKTAARNS